MYLIWLKLVITMIHVQFIVVDWITPVEFLSVKIISWQVLGFMVSSSGLSTADIYSTLAFKNRNVCSAPSSLKSLEAFINYTQ